jgi:hypothetical protein
MRRCETIGRKNDGEAVGSIGRLGASPGPAISERAKPYGWLRRSVAEAVRGPAKARGGRAGRSPSRSGLGGDPKIESIRSSSAARRQASFSRGESGRCGADIVVCSSIERSCAAMVNEG